MAKIAYSKLALNKKSNKEPKIIEFNEQQIEVIQYLSIEEKLDLISDIITWSIDKNSYINYCRVEMFYLVKIIQAYTNITFTEKQADDVFKLYDQFVGSNFATVILETIPKEEIDFIHNNVINVIKGIYEHKNSILGILESVSADYSNLDLEASEIQAKIADPSNMELLKNILSKLG